ncbi:MAG: type II secretion system protein GspM [Congregibacter sp.]
MKAWFLRFPLREQLALLIMLTAVVLYVLFVLLIIPQGRARMALAESNAATAAQLSRVDVLASQISALRAGTNTGSSRARPGLSALLNDSAIRYTLQISRLQPNSRGAVQLRIETAELDALLRWIHHLETGENLLIEELSLSQTSNAGVVSATLRVAGAT